jgi:cbb3-type cytochrome oxidase maturation protein
MQILFFMIGVSLAMGLVFLGAFFWATRSGQNDDLFTPGMRVLIEEDEATETNSPKPKLL